MAVVPLLLLAAPTSVSLSLHPPRMSLLDTTLITGASSGIGEASARALASAGCKSMVLAARRLDRLEALRDNLLADHEGLSIHAVQLDVTDLDAVLRLPEELPKDFSEVSVLLNNAGLAAGFGGVVGHRGLGHLLKQQRPP